MVVLDSFPFTDNALRQREANSCRNGIVRRGPADPAAEEEVELLEDPQEIARSAEPVSNNSPFLRCGKCHYQTKIESLLRAHIARHLLDSDFQCPTCDFHDSDSSLFVDHLATHHNGNTLMCPLCRKKMSKCDLKSHVMLHKAASLYDCSMCEFSTNYVKSIKRHTEAFHVRLYKCSHCGLALTKHEIQLHVKSAHDSAGSVPESVTESPDGIPKSSQEVSEKSADTSDNTTHVGGKCSDHQSSEESVRQFCSENHSQNPRTSTRIRNRAVNSRRNFSCDNCLNSGNGAPKTPTKKSLQTVENDAKPPPTNDQSPGRLQFRCLSCAFSTKQKRNLMQHTEAFHTKEYQCAKCEKVMCKYDLLLHMETSHGSQRSGSNRSQVSAGINSQRLETTKNMPAPDTPTEEGLQNTKNDSKSSPTNDPISGKAPNCCPSCDFSSTNKGNLRRHIEAMHSKEYECKKCKKVMCKYDLLLHMGTSHGSQGPSSNPSQDPAGISRQGLESTKNMPASHSKVILEQGHIGTSSGLQMFGPKSGPSVEINCQDLIPENFPKSSPKLLTQTHSGRSQTVPLEVIPSSHASGSLPTKYPIAATTQKIIKRYAHCSKCDYKTKNRKLLKRHTSKHLIDNSFVCRKCGFKEMEAVKFLAHLRSHNSNSKIIQCCFCKFRATSNTHGILRHLSTHRRVQLLDCPECEFTAGGGRLENLRSHVINFHTKKYRCMTCDKEMTKFELGRHSKKCSQDRTSDGDSHVVEEPQGNRCGDEVAVDYQPGMSSTATNELRTLTQIEPDKRTCEFINSTKVHIRACSVRLIPDDAVDPDNKIGRVAFKNVPQNPGTTMQPTPSSAVLNSDNFGLRKCQVVLERLKISSSKQNLGGKFALGGKTKFLVQSTDSRPANGGKIIKKPMLHCNECVFTTKRRNLLRKHVVKHLVDFRLRCPYCGYKEWSSSAFAKHVVLHQGDDTTFKCCFCDSKPLGYRHTLGDHLNKHRPVTLLDCPKCEFSTYRSDMLKGHVENMHIKRYNCPACGAVMSKCRLVQHMGKAHGQVLMSNARMTRLRTKEQPIVLENEAPGNHGKPSPICETSVLEGSNASKSARFSAHDILAIGNKTEDLGRQTSDNYSEAEAKPMFKAAVADGSASASSDSDALARNIDGDRLAEDGASLRPNPRGSRKSPSGIPMQKIDPQKSLAKYSKPYLCCSKCSFKTRMKSLLKQHVAKHLIDNRFTCTECSFKESCSWKFARHWFTHSGDSHEMIKCCFCASQFKKRSSLKGSLPRHFDERHRVVHLFDCPKCHFSCSDKRKMETHYEKNHVKLHLCDVCGKVATLKRSSKHVDAFQRFCHCLEEPSGSDQVSEQVENGSLSPHSAELESMEIEESLSPSTSKLPNDLTFTTQIVPVAWPRFAIPSGRKDNPEGMTRNADVSLPDVSANVSLDQTDATTPLTVAYDKEYSCVVCRSWVSLNNVVIHQQLCSNSINNSLGREPINVIATSAVNTENATTFERSCQGPGSTISGPGETNFEPFDPYNGHSEFPDLEATKPALENGATDGGNPLNNSGDSSLVGLKPTNFGEGIGVESVNLDADATSEGAKVQSTSQFDLLHPSEVSVINIPSDSEDSYGSSYSDSQLVVNDGSAPAFNALNFTNVLRDRFLKDLLELPIMESALPECQSRNLPSRISSEQSYGKQRPHSDRRLDSPHHFLTSDYSSSNQTANVRDSPVPQVRDAGCQLRAVRLDGELHSGLPTPVETPVNEPWNIPSGSAAAGLICPPRLLYMPENYAPTRSGMLSKSLAVTASKTPTNSARAPSSAYPENNGFPPSRSGFR